MDKDIKGLLDQTMITEPVHSDSISNYKGRKRTLYTGEQKNEELKLHIDKGTKLIKKLKYFYDKDITSYKKHMVMASKFIFRDIVYTDKVKHKYASNNYTIDILLPFRPDMISQAPLWEPWYYKYKIRSILIEVKDYGTKQNNICSSTQMQSWLTDAKRGKLGIVISRTGFSRKILKSLRSFTEEGNGLILPIDHNETMGLAKLSVPDTSDVVSFLYEKEADLLCVQ